MYNLKFLKNISLFLLDIVKGSKDFRYMVEQLDLCKVLFQVVVHHF